MDIEGANCYIDYAKDRDSDRGGRGGTVIYTFKLEGFLFKKCNNF